MDQTSLFNKTTLLTFHQEQVNDGDNNTENTLEIVSIIGGIDHILNDYLTHNDLELSADQIQKIYRIISTPNIFKNKYNQKRSNNHQIQKQCHNENDISLTFDVNDTCLHKVFNNTTAETILKYLYNKYLICGMLISWIISVSLYFIFDKKTSIVYPLSATLSSFIYLPYIALCILSVNRLAFKYIVTSFEFWFKMYYTALWFVSDYIYEYTLRANHYSLITLWRAQHIMSLLFMTTFFVFVSLFDGLYRHTRIKIVISLFMAVPLGLFSFYYEFLQHSADGTDPSILKIYNGISVSLLSILSNSLRILSIFTLKQAVLTYWNQYRQNKSILIGLTPRLHWKGIKSDVIEQKLIANIDTKFNENETEIEMKNNVIVTDDEEP